jgi:hypothetical protein
MMKNTGNSSCPKQICLVCSLTQQAAAQGARTNNDIFPGFNFHVSAGTLSTQSISVNVSPSQQKPHISVHKKRRKRRSQVTDRRIVLGAFV